MEECYINLIIAIIEQAKADYKNALRGKRTAEKEKTIRECERFFLSGWGDMLMNGNGEYVMQRCRKEVAQEKKEE